VLKGVIIVKYYNTYLGFVNRIRALIVKSLNNSLSFKKRGVVVVVVVDNNDDEDDGEEEKQHHHHHHHQQQQRKQRQKKKGVFKTLPLKGGGWE
jgi:ABC-type Zn2+ transport system substrate-binding protein/surface adhesin